MLQLLSKVRDDLCQELNLNKESVELSMGMSNDFEHAVSALLCLHYLFLFLYVHNLHFKCSLTNFIFLDTVRQHQCESREFNIWRKKMS